MSHEKIKILFQDEYYIAVEKPAHLLVHPYKKETNEKRCLMKDVRDQIGQYIYPIHRLDRPVSGIVVFGLQPDPVKKIKDQWHSTAVKKFYKALVRGHFTEPGEFTFSLNNEKKVLQEAHTKYWPKTLYDSATLVDIEIFTGRKHQIRRHFSRRVQAVLGDRTYGKKKYNDYYLENYNLERIFLHGSRFQFTHPYTDELITIDSPLPDDLQSVIDQLVVEKVQEYE